MVIEERSSLGLDSTYLGAWAGGGIQQSALSAAHSSLSTVRVVLEAGTMPMTGLYPLLRAAIESSSLAIYLLDPGSRDERLERFYRVAAEESRHRKNYQDAMGSSDAILEHANSIAELRALTALRPSLVIPENHWKKGPSNSDIVTAAGGVIATHPSTLRTTRMPLLAQWQVLSGLSHAKMWALLTVLRRSNAVFQGTTGNATVEMRSNDATIAFFLTQAVEALQVALRLYGQRSTAQFAQPEDAREPH
jgi:hypothetical protein